MFETASVLNDCVSNLLTVILNRQNIVVVISFSDRFVRGHLKLAVY